MPHSICAIHLQEISLEAHAFHAKQKNVHQSIASDIRNELLACPSMDMAYNVFLNRLRMEIVRVNRYLDPLGRHIRADRIDVVELRKLFEAEITAWGRAGDARATALLS